MTVESTSVTVDSRFAVVFAVIGAALGIAVALLVSPVTS